jgi:tetrapyrrole (corrin/porphyrin) methylase-like protein
MVDWREAQMTDVRLIAVGTGIRVVGQFTPEALAWIKRADEVFYVVSDPIAEEVIKTLNPKGAQSMAHFYGENKPRMETYRQMVEFVLERVRGGSRVCLTASGHPGVLVYPTHEAIRRARAEGFEARMLPAISTEDCLFADLGIDPVVGCQSFEATDFLINLRHIDPYSHVLLWQIGGLGDSTFKRHAFDLKGMPQLVQKLMRYYPPNHIAYLYETSIFPGVEPMIRSGALADLPFTRPTPSSTLYIPPVSAPPPDTGVWRR